MGQALYLYLLVEHEILFQMGEAELAAQQLSCFFSFVRERERERIRVKGKKASFKQQK